MPRKVKNWCFTIFDTSAEKIVNLCALDCEYVIFQKEQCPETQREHLQGYIQLSEGRTLSQFKQFIGDPRAHCEATRNIKKSIEYCSKEETRIDGPWEFGTKPAGNIERRRDLDDAFQIIQQHKSWIDVVNDERIRSVLFRCRGWCRMVFDARRINEDIPQISGWQLLIDQQLEQQPSNRKITWIWSKEGGRGKSTFAKYLMLKHHAFVVNRGSSNDIAYAYDHQRIVVFDYPRSTQVEFIHFTLMEDFKNGIIFSPKYESKSLSFTTPHVIVLSNIDPQNCQEKLSSDRWNEINVD